MAGGTGKTFRSEPAQDFSNGNGAVPTTLLPGSKESGSAEMGEDRGRSFAGSKEVDEAGERGEGLGGTVWGGAYHGLPEVARAQTRWPRG